MSSNLQRKGLKSFMISLVKDVMGRSSRSSGTIKTNPSSLMIDFFNDYVVHQSNYDWNSITRLIFLFEETQNTYLEHLLGNCCQSHTFWSFFSKINDPRKRRLDCELLCNFLLIEYVNFLSSRSKANVSIIKFQKLSGKNL